MTLDEAVYTRLTTHAGVSALVATRVYPVVLPQAPTFPALTYQLISEIRPSHIGGPGHLPGALYQVTAWGTTLLSVRAVLDAVRGALDGYQGTVGTVVIQASILEEQRDDPGYQPEVGIYGASADYRIWWNES